jgi:hypothetical protein
MMKSLKSKVAFVLEPEMDEPTSTMLHSCSKNNRFG